MERTESTNSILRQFRKKSKRLVNKDLFTEFFYLNKDRKVIEFLVSEDKLVVESFLKSFLPSEFRSFVKVRILNDEEDEIKSWFYDNEDLVLVIEVNWGVKKQEISLDIDIENFSVAVIDEEGLVLKEIDYVLFNEFLISFFTLQAQNLAQSFDKLSKKSEC
jgi:hypothetical protein